MSIETVLEAQARIGESPTWVPHENALYWIDVKAPALHRYQLASGATRSWRLTSDVGGFAFFEDGSALVALRHGLHRLDLIGGALTLLAAPPFDPALFRFNEAACDANGRFWVGVMFDPENPADGQRKSQAGALHSFTQAGGLREEPDTAELHNGMAWSADGRTFYLSHSYAGSIFAFDFDPAGGQLSGRRLFASVPPELGIPDGAAIDTEGGYWCALHGGGRLRRFTAQGEIERDVMLPMDQPTMCAFAGPDLATLYITSASDPSSTQQQPPQPQDGNLLRLTPDHCGIPRPFTVR